MNWREVEIVVGSLNANKIEELQAIARGFDLRLIGIAEFAKKKRLGSVPDVVEDGSTFEENAIIKAKAYSEWTGITALADDSGLCVDALGGAPGIYSARYAGADTPHSEKMFFLLQELAQKEQESAGVSRSAHFECSLALHCPNGDVYTSKGILEGNILEAPRGNGGFGYDPIVEIAELGKTLAEVDFQTTCKVGFRAKAAQKLFSQLL